MVPKKQVPTSFLELSLTTKPENFSMLQFQPFLLSFLFIPKHLRFSDAIWMFPKIGVPQNGWFVRENPIKWMIWGYHYFWKHPYVHFAEDIHNDLSGR